MKNLNQLLVIFSIILSSRAFALKKLPCDDPRVVLTLRNIECQRTIVIPDRFDIPDLKIDYDKVELIFKREDERALGGISGGGGHTAPTSRVQNNLSTFQNSFDLSCEAILTSDGAKKYQVVSKQSFKLSNSNTLKKLRFRKHYLSERTSSELHPIPRKPRNLDTSGFMIEISNPQAGSNEVESEVELNICRDKIKSRSGSMKICASSITELSQTKIKTKLKVKTISNDRKLRISQELVVSCR